jgi:glutamate-1-semialdehyde 2,1-aminomutase
MLDRGVMLPPSQHEAWFVSLAHTRGDVDAAVGAARLALSTCREDQ